MNKYFLYIRKSTDEDDRQVLSLEAQETELLEFAQREHLIVIDTFRESQSAKTPGRSVFNAMLERIEKDEADGILAWHPDRLARNSVDGGKIIYLVDTEKIKALKFPTFWFEATPQGKFMLNIAFGQSKYFVDNLSENIKRGTRQKLRRGEFPGWAPLGYLNDLKNHTIIKDPAKDKLVKKLFEIYAAGNYSLNNLKKVMTAAGLLSRKNNALSTSNIYSILNNPFYYGVFKYNGEIHQGKHEPIITKKLFEACQKIMKDRSSPKKRGQTEYAFRGLLKCGECGYAITSETQKGHNYYRCTKKWVSCSQKYIREEALAEQVSDILQKVSLPKGLTEKFIIELDKDKENELQAGLSFAQNLKLQIKEFDEKLDKLLDAHLENTISREEYISKKQKVLNKKIELVEKLKDFERKGNYWLEPLRRFLNDAQQAGIIALGENFSEKKNFLKKIGSNLILRERAVYFSPRGAWKILLNSPFLFPNPRQNSPEISKNSMVYDNWLHILDNFQTLTLTVENTLIARN